MKYIFLIIMIFNILKGGVLEKLYFNSASKTYYKDINSSQFILLQDCFYKLLSDNNSSCLDKFGFKKVDINSSIYAVVDTKKRGHGFYLIRKNSSNNYLLSMPHRFSDKKTGVIGMRLFRENQFKAAFFATATRRVKDMAHNIVTPFNAFHIAYAKYYPDTHIYQLHGFTSKKRKTKEGKRAKIILSSGSKRYTEDIIKLYKCFKRSISVDTFVYGKDIYELGATTNAQANSLHRLGFWNFFHIEMIYNIRENLAYNKTFRDRFAKCLLDY